MDASINKDLKFIFVVGPTATGKSAWALQQAEKYQGSILNIDSVQFYQGLEIGSAAPNQVEKARVPHYLYSYVSAPGEMTAGNYLRDFYQLIESTPLKSPVFIVGGTGFYIQALEKGMYDLEPTNPEVRKKIELELAEIGPEKLFAELSAADPTHPIHINDHYRLVRAIEILRYYKKTPADFKNLKQINKNAFPFPYLKIGFSLPKEEALLKVQQRTEWMLGHGMIEETENFLKLGFEKWAPLSSVGYKDVVDFLLHNNSRSELFGTIVRSTMKLIKKQKTWFKRDLTVLWSDFSADSLTEIERQLDLFLTAIDPTVDAKR